MPASKNVAGEPTPDPRMEDLTARVEHLESVIDRMVTGKVAEISQEERDRRTLSRLPNSFPEAVEYEAAQKRQTARDEAGKTPEPAAPSES